MSYVECKKFLEEQIEARFNADERVIAERAYINGLIDDINNFINYGRELCGLKPYEGPKRTNVDCPEINEIMTFVRNIRGKTYLQSEVLERKLNNGVKLSIIDKILRISPEQKQNMVQRDYEEYKGVADLSLEVMRAHQRISGKQAKKSVEKAKENLRQIKSEIITQVVQDNLSSPLVREVVLDRCRGNKVDYEYGDPIYAEINKYAMAILQKSHENGNNTVKNAKNDNQTFQE